MSEQKSCRSCKEPIADGAKWCPHCQRPQSPLRAVFPVPAIVVVLVALLGYGYLTERSMENTFEAMGGKAIYSGNGQLEITESNMQVGKTGKGCDACVTVIGKVKNHSKTPWANIHFQAELMDANGKVIDVINDKDSDFVVGPESEGSFKISGRASAASASYHSHRVKITKAGPDQKWY